MLSPILVTDSFKDVKHALTAERVEGIIWKDAVPDVVLDTVTGFDFSRIAEIKQCFTSGRDLWKKEVVVDRRISGLFKELAVVEQHIDDTIGMFSNHCGGLPPKARAGLPPIHFVSDDPLVLNNQVPHIDPVKPKRVYRGQLGAHWNAAATATNYPSYKILAALNRDSKKSTILIPSCDLGDEDITRPAHYPDADRSRQVQANVGDIVILKNCVTAHLGPSHPERRWLSVY